MDTTTLKVPLSKTLKKQAKSQALKQGFSSLQELVRVLLTKVSRQELTIQVEQWPAVRMSKKAEERYGKMMKDFETGKNVYHASSIDEFLKQLHED